MVVGSFIEEHVSPFPPSRVWKASIVDANNLHPKVLPEIIASIEPIQGDGGVGSVRIIHFTPAVKEVTFIKERIDVVDHENHIFKYAIIDGGLIGKKLKTYSFELRFEATADGGSKCKVTVEYDTVEGETLTDEEISGIKGGGKGLVDAINGYLHANPGAYV